MRARQARRPVDASRGRARADRDPGGRAAAPRTARDRPGRSSRPPRPRPRSRRSCPSTARGRAAATRPGAARTSSRRAANVGRASSGVAASRPIVIRPRTSSWASASRASASRAQGVGLPAGLRRVAVHVDLEQHGQRAAGSQLRGEGRQPPGERRPSPRSGSTSNSADRAAGLVALERPDEVPRRPGHLGRLRLGLLDPVLAEHREARRRRPRGSARRARSWTRRPASRRRGRGPPARAARRSARGPPRGRGGTPRPRRARGARSWTSAAGPPMRGPAVSGGGGSSGSRGRPRRTCRTCGPAAPRRRCAAAG